MGGPSPGGRSEASGGGPDDACCGGPGDASGGPFDENSVCISYKGTLQRY